MVLTPTGVPKFKAVTAASSLPFAHASMPTRASYFQDDNLPASVTTGRDLDSGAFIRRAQFGVEGKVFKDFWYEIRYEFGGSGTEGSGTINLMRVAYQGIPNFRVNVGVIQPVFTHADAVSSNEITFIERASVINTIVGAYGGSDSRRGVEMTFQKSGLFYEGDNFVLTGAYTGASTTSADGTDEGTQILGRTAFRLWSDGTSNIQIGADGAKILQPTGAAVPGGAKNINLQDRPEMRSDSTRLVSTGSIPAEGGWLYGFEGGANIKNFYVSGEYYKFGIDRDRACTGCNTTAVDPEFTGWYVEGSWVLTGQPKTYSAKSNSNQVGVWGSPTVIRPFSISEGGWGAFELTGRYSVLDLNFREGLPGTAIATAAGAIRGGEQTIWTVGLNWYMNANIRMMFNYLNIDVDRMNAAGLQAGQELDAVAGRLQFAF